MKQGPTTGEAITALNSTSWTVTVSDETDQALRRYLDAAGQGGDISDFVEEAVRWRMFDATLQAVKDRNAGDSPDALQAMIDDACRDVRVELAQGGTGKPR